MRQYELGRERLSQLMDAIASGQGSDADHAEAALLDAALHILRGVVPGQELVNAILNKAATPLLDQAAAIAREGSAVDNLVLGTVNSPWKTLIDAETLVARLSSGGADEWLPHLATFFGEVRAELILAFAVHHAVPADTLRASYIAVQSTRPVKAAEAGLAGVD